MVYGLKPVFEVNEDEEVLGLHSFDVDKPISSLKSYLSDDVTTIETGRPTAYSKKLSTER